MKLRWLRSLGVFFSLCTLVNGGDALEYGNTSAASAKISAGYLLHPVLAPEREGAVIALPYTPQAGDVILYDDFSKFHHFIYKLARTEAPIHVSMVIARKDGTPAILEMTGPKAITAKVILLDVGPRLASYPGTMMVRRIRQPLTPEQSEQLTCFAEQQVGKRFAVSRILLQATPFNPHRGIRRSLFGHTYLNRNRWFCSELVVAAGTCAQLFDPQIHYGNATYPRDLAYDETMDLSDLFHPALPWVADKASVPGGFDVSSHDR